MHLRMLRCFRRVVVVRSSLSCPLTHTPTPTTKDLLGNKAGRAKSRFRRRREAVIEETGDFDPIYGCDFDTWLVCVWACAGCRILLLLSFVVLCGRCVWEYVCVC